MVAASAVVSEVEKAPPLKTTVPVGQVTVAGVLSCGGLSELTNATLYPFGLLAQMISTRKVWAVPEALLTRARQPPATGSEVFRLVPGTAKPFVSDAPHPRERCPSDSSPGRWC